jgi:gag-polypeptide of LTR copia-type
LFLPENLAKITETKNPVPESPIQPENSQKMSTIIAQQIDNSKLTNIILNCNQNYIPWSKSVSIALGGRGKLGHVTGTKPKPKPAKPEVPTAEETRKIKEWKETDLSIMFLLIQTMEPKIVRLCMLLSSSKAIWDKVKNLYRRHQNFAHIYNIKEGTRNPTDYGIEIQAK